MFRFNRKPKISLKYEGETERGVRFKAIEIRQGRAELRNVDIDIQSVPGGEYFTQESLLDNMKEWRFNGVPLIYVNAHYCETTRAMLMAGHGKRELDRYFSNINHGFAWENAIDALRPLLELFEDGLWWIEEGKGIPTDGEDAFFWDVGDRPRTYAATGSYFYKSDGIDYSSSHPMRYLYPSEFSSHYDESRVDHYIAHYQKHGIMPAVLTLQLPGSMSLILDGHHKACACALLGIEVPLIEISNKQIVTQYNSNLQLIWIGGKWHTIMGEIRQKRPVKKPRIKGISFLESSHAKKDWNDYAHAVWDYPTHEHLLLKDYLGNPQINVAYIEAALYSGNSDALQYLVTELPEFDEYFEFLRRVICLNKDDFILKKMALERLISSQSDETEAFLIECLVELEPHSGVRELILSYWTGDQI
ncbi:hypothetical protein G7062_11130 [Erysipelothrix sp. HDW6C]|uniref:hypothetical protein n=1 Tax=Erysipelothrix sp. HDW6C TaxID=2714930 RepID=UPI00140C66A4|nr:hypothetical protein [Erysipelothrix sp. HDW6C]QIK70813.1 hypothetical protein G7062_11130 [Erysipelothrix sp. HDW6C]